jgi:hypothetical protein
MYILVLLLKDFIHPHVFCVQTMLYRSYISSSWNFVEHGTELSTYVQGLMDNLGRLGLGYISVTVPPKTVGFVVL